MKKFEASSAKDFKPCPIIDYHLSVIARQNEERKKKAEQELSKLWIW